MSPTALIPVLRKLFVSEFVCIDSLLNLYRVHGTFASVILPDPPCFDYTTFGVLHSTAVPTQIFRTFCPQSFLKPSASLWHGQDRAEQSVHQNRRGDRSGVGGNQQKSRLPPGT